MKTDNKGQTLYYFLIFTMILVISWAMMLNIAKLIRDRMIMQNTADNIALSIAVHKARTMNFVAGCNNLIGSLLALGTKPSLVQIPTYSTEFVAAVPYFDYKDNTFNEAFDRDVGYLKKAVDGLMEAQEKAMQSHLTYVVSLTPIYAARGYALIVNPYKYPSLANAEKSFGLKRNKKRIRYLKTINTQLANIPHIVYNPFPIAGLKDSILQALDMFPPLKAIFRVLELSGMDFDEIIGQMLDKLGISEIVGEKVYATTDHSWYISDGENMYKQKIKVSLSKLPNSKNDPLFKKFLNIAYPLITVFSASSIYNTKGTMFPEEESNLVGMLPADTELTLDAAVAKQDLELMKGIVELIPPPIGKLLAAGVEIYILGIKGEHLLRKYDGVKNSPMGNYEKAKEGGWAAHLVPYKTEEEEAREAEEEPDEADGGG